MFDDEGRDLPYKHGDQHVGADPLLSRDDRPGHGRKLPALHCRFTGIVLALVPVALVFALAHVDRLSGVGADAKTGPG